MMFGMGTEIQIVKRVADKYNADGDWFPEKWMMIAFLEQHRDDLEALCRRYRVARLELFGSAVTKRFNPASSDLDFLVEFHPDSPMGPFHQYFDFLADLKNLLGRKVDLVEANAMRKPYFINSVNRRRELVYAA